MPQPIYVTSLFGLLGDLGWVQQDIARHLGISKTTTSLWATGKRPLSRKYEQPFFDLVNKVLLDSESSLSQSKIKAEEIWPWIHAWSVEMDAKMLEYIEKIRSSLDIIQSHDASRTLMTLTRQDRLRLRIACSTLGLYLDYLDPIVVPDGLRRIIDLTGVEAS